MYENKNLWLDELEEQACLHVLRSGVISGMSPEIEMYENELSEYFQSAHALAVSNGTAAIELALRAVGVDREDEVIVTALGPIMTYLPIVSLGAIPVFVDTNSPKTFVPNVEEVESRINPKTKAIMVVPMWGYPIDMEELNKVGTKYGIPIIEDASHCHGAQINGKYVGTLADIGIFSTQERKLVCTGEGGFLLFQNEDLFLRAKEMRNFGKPYRQEYLQAGLADTYGHMFGMNYRLSGILAAIGRIQLKKLDEKIAIRTRNAEYLKQAILPHTEYCEWESSGTQNYYSLLLYSDDSKVDSTVIQSGLKEWGIISDPYRYKYSVAYQMPIFIQFGRDCLNSESLVESIITLPVHEGLKEENLKYVAKTFLEVVSKSDTHSINSSSKR